MTYHRHPEVFPGAWIESRYMDDDDTGIGNGGDTAIPDRPADSDQSNNSESEDVSIDSQSPPKTSSQSKAMGPESSGPKNRDHSPDPQVDEVAAPEKKNKMAEPPIDSDSSLKPEPDSDAMDIDQSPNSKHPKRFDLLHSVKGMFRVLDLITESGSPQFALLVDKIIIDQESFKNFINFLSPGAYVSLTKVNFRILDKLPVKPVGIYGSRSEIVAFLSSKGVIGDDTARVLNAQTDNTSGSKLRSGLYVLHVVPEVAGFNQVFVIYWPESTTWNDDAISSVRRNRITFMRYLTKVSDQILCLISPEHARAIVWNDEAEEIPMEIEAGSDRLFTFEVAKTNQQEENVTARPGFTMNAPVLAKEEVHAEFTLDELELQPTLVPGETAQAILTKHFVPSKSTNRIIRWEPYNAVQLKSLIEKGTIRLGPSLTDEGIEILMDNGLSTRFPAPFKAWKARNKTAKELIEAEGKKMEHEVKQRVTDESPQLEPIFREAIIDKILHLYPTTIRSVLSSSSEEDIESLREKYKNFVTVHPKFKDELEKTIFGARGDQSNRLRLSAAFSGLKEKLICIDVLLGGMPDLEASDREQLIKRITDVGVDGVSEIKSKDTPTQSQGWMNRLAGWFSDDKTVDPHKIRREVRGRLATMSDCEFLGRLDGMLSGEPLLQELITQTVEEANTNLQGTVKTLLERLVGRSVLVQHETLKAQIQRTYSAKLEEQQKSSRAQLIEEYESELPPSTRTLLLEGIQRQRQSYGTPGFKIDATDKSRSEPAIECKLHILHLTTDDRHEMQLNSNFVPSPNLQASSDSSFRMPLGHRILHMQLLESGKLLLIIADAELLYIYFDSLVALDSAISRGRGGVKRSLHRDKIGEEIILAYDEQKRMLSLCAASKMLLHIYQFDETFSTLQAWGNILDFRPWYTAGTFITRSCFVCGSEEILFVDTSGQARIFSLISQQFRPASLALENTPIGLYSSPDGACLILGFKNGEQLCFRAYHWATFGSSMGIDLGALDLSSTLIISTSLVNRRNVHLVSLDVDANVCRSMILDITKKVTEFMFKETGVKSHSKLSTVVTSHNSLIDCFADVWTRFPVVAAVQRRTILSSIDRKARKIIFVTDRDHDRFAAHFSELIYAFEQRTKKPTGDVLKNTQISALSSSSSFLSKTLSDVQWLSEFRAGEWLVDILCLIPIQIAVTRENRFLPLKDGIMSASLERSLLGAEVGQIVDLLSFGLFESIFQSYMNSKPVKVVSSMGEQSVGKSFSLNHLVDTSFAGSAMRTTEGVWMSVTPTDDTLIVALDFEGVHSIERSAQEDTLLVLFNTALSNLVLFRNNFAMSRSITGLFSSFQSSGSIFNPSQNPTLFRSTLTIIIKFSRFSTKFQKIVEDEQDANFISRLHAGQLSIVPWPVIESKQFYLLFPAMKRLLDKQEITHRTAGEFLHTLKTLMAKLKANDWGSISQTLVAHRSQRLLSGLSNALAYGLFEVEPEPEPLKNFDTDLLIEKPDTAAQFFLSNSNSSGSQREAILAALQKSWPDFNGRSHTEEATWFQELSAYLANLTELRIEHVHEWIFSNLSRFKTSNANIEVLKRLFETSIVDLRANIELCGAQCANCHLKCLLSRRHDSNMTHDCQTTHHCVRICDYAEEHPLVQKTCGLPAGHAGHHICAVDVHLCGEPCQLNNKQGCLGRCMKMSEHPEDEHMCSARLHKCGEACDLKNIKVSGKLYSLKIPTPNISVMALHALCLANCVNVCVLMQTIFMVFKLVPSISAAHSCTATCQAQGICEIETAPQSIEATFTGRHETFQYTKYSQVAKRRPCAFPIPPGERTHSGPHIHTTDPALFHFCETRCESCGYYCTLPRGHTQQEHRTSHGSMSKTQWAIDGPDGTILELKRHKFGSNDDGAPMMCNVVCQDMGRHAHLDYCRADNVSACGGLEIQHIKTRMKPNPDRQKDWITHSLFWKRSDPYSRPLQLEFNKCDAFCPDAEHAGTATDPPHPSYCVLPLFHPPATVAAGLGYLSNDGHVFNCKNPSVMQQAFHVSGSMSATDRGPLANAPGTALISRSSNNRLGAVYSALHGFWMSRNTALSNNGRSTAVPARRDAYSVVLFDHTMSVCIANDFTSTPDDLLQKVLPTRSGGGTNFTMALTTAQQLMQDHWSTERTPVVIFLSDGECSISDETVRGLCRKAVALGKPLSFHAVSFGQASHSSVLRRMVQIALEVQTKAPRDPLLPAEAVINSSYSTALDTVRLAETFLGFAESLRKPPGKCSTGLLSLELCLRAPLFYHSTRLPCVGVTLVLPADRLKRSRDDARVKRIKAATVRERFDLGGLLWDVGGARFLDMGQISSRMLRLI
ncbi:VWFA domain-containing protein [Favolaschia claudopus]|uniref:VWFA domain-containing protein n=1 Tax=Favolaschia claudopus TaxID=2862362 RepID=A0AAW0BG82_9AGAR